MSDSPSASSCHFLLRHATTGPEKALLDVEGKEQNYCDDVRGGKFRKRDPADVINTGQDVALVNGVGLLIWRYRGLL